MVEHQTLGGLLSVYDLTIHDLYYHVKRTNLKKLVEMGYMHHQRCEIDRRSVRVKLTPEGRRIHKVVAELFQRHADGLVNKQVLSHQGLEDITSALKRMERYWADQIRYIY